MAKSFGEIKVDESDLAGLATAAWRLEKWLDSIEVERKMAAKSSLRAIRKYLDSINVTIADPLGSKFDPGLAIDVVGNEDDSAPEEELYIVDTLAPYVYLDGLLVQYARVILGTLPEETANKQVHNNDDTQN